MTTLHRRVGKLEQVAQPNRTVFVVVEEAGIDPVPAYLAAHPENAHCNIVVVDTGIHRPTEA